METFLQFDQTIISKVERLSMMLNLFLSLFFKKF